MPSDPKYIKDFKAFARAGIVSAPDVIALEKELFGASDRATAVMMASITELSIRTLLIKRLRADLNSDEKDDLFGTRGPLNSFVDKINMAHAVGAIGPLTKSDLHLIRILRNEFAHSRKSFQFSTPEATEVCAHLRTPDLPDAIMPSGFAKNLSVEEWNKTLNLKDPRQRYLIACHRITIRAGIGSLSIESVSNIETGLP